MPLHRYRLKSATDPRMDFEGTAARIWTLLLRTKFFMFRNRMLWDLRDKKNPRPVAYMLYEGVPFPVSAEFQTRILTLDEDLTVLPAQRRRIRP